MAEKALTNFSQLLKTSSAALETSLRNHAHTYRGTQHSAFLIDISGSVSERQDAKLRQRFHELYWKHEDRLRRDLLEAEEEMMRIVRNLRLKVENRVQAFDREFEEIVGDGLAQAGFHYGANYYRGYGTGSSERGYDSRHGGSEWNESGSGDVDMVAGPDNAGMVRRIM